MTNNKNIERYIEMLKDLPQVKYAKHLKSVTSSVTTNWGAEAWSPLQISLDCYQNFRDSCVSAKIDISNVKTEIKGDQISIYAPPEYNLEKLYYIGSQKADEENQVGINGEGQKKVFSDLCRHSIYDPICISGSQALIVGVGDEVKGTELRPLVYHYFEINKVKGSYLILNKVMKKEFKDAFKSGLKNFFYDSNPLIGEKLWEYNGISCYKSNSSNGSGFYRRLKRVEIKDIPIIINIDKSYAALEKRVKSDRDRKAFDQRVQSIYFGIFSRSGFAYKAMIKNPAIRYILEKSKKIWHKGHPLLSSVASHSYGSLKDDKSLKDLFDKRYTAESKWTWSRNISYDDWFSTKTQNFIRRRDQDQKKKGKINLPSYFTSFGVISSLEAFIRAKSNAEKRIKNKKTKELSSKENKAINFLFKASKGLNPSFANLFNRDDEDNNLYDVKFKKISCKNLLGELKNNSDYNSKTIYLHKDLFKTNSFGKVFSTFLHELSHANGNGDGSREFSDMLTLLLENSIDKNKKINHYSKEWNKYRA